MPEVNDFQLIKEFVDGNEQAFNKIATRYQQKIYWHARKMLGNHLDADEVTQEVLLVMYRKLSHFNFQSGLYTWIYRIVSTRCLNYLRKQKVKQLFSFDSFDEKELKDEHDIVVDIDNKNKLKKLDSMLLKLPPRQREVFILRNFEELSYEEISKITSKSVGGLKANYFHALKKISELMKNEE